MGIEFSANPIMWTVRILFASILIVVSYLIVSSFITQTIDSDQLEMQLFLEQIYHSDLIMYEDSVTFRVYPGIIDLGKFKAVNLSNEIHTKRRDLAVRLVLTYENEELEKYYLPGREEDAYDVFASLSSFNNQVVRFSQFPFKQHVLIQTSEGLKEGDLTMWVLKQV